MNKDYSKSRDWSKELTGCLGLLCLFVILVIVKVVVTNYVEHSASNSFRQMLSDESKQLNTGFPRKLSDYLRIDSTSVIPDNLLVYHLSFLQSTDSVDLDQTEIAIRASLFENLRSDPAIIHLRDKGLTIEFQFSDLSGKQLFNIFISPKDTE